VTGRLSRETGYAAARELLGSREPPTALIAGNNQLTVGALEALRELGARVPTDLSLVACDDIDLTRMHDPPLDVIDRDPEQHGRETAELLLRRLEDTTAPPRRVLLPTSFIRRESSGIPAVAVGAAVR
jgi:LacI family transcriptional regulator